MGAYKKCVASFHVFKKWENEAKKKKHATTPTSRTPQTTTLTSTKLEIRNAVRQWASNKVLKQLEREPKTMKTTVCTTTITQMTTTQSHATTQSSTEIIRTTISPRFTRLAIHHALRPLIEML